MGTLYAKGDVDVNRAKELFCIKNNYLCEVKLLWKCIPRDWKRKLKCETVLCSYKNTRLHFVELTPKIYHYISVIK